MSKTTIKELALSLSEKHDLSKADAERFVATIFEVINDGLEDDKLVKVKGLGAFKIIGVAARKSVDVNTGEPIVIEGRNKISFTPDASMRDDVNKPFSQFETVIINDGVDFSSIDKEYENKNETVENEEKVTTDKDDNKEQEKTENEISKDTETLIKSEPGDRERLTKDHSQEMPLSTESDSAAKNDPPTESVTPAESGSSAESDIPAVKDETPAESETSTVNKETPAEEETFTVNKETPAESKSSAEVDFATERRDIEREVEKELINYKETHPSHAMKVLAITAVVFVIACLCGGYYLFSQIQRRDSHIEMLEKQMRMVAQQQKEKKVATKPSKQIPQAKQEQDTLPQETDGKQDDAKLMTQADSKQETLKAADKQTALQDQYNKDVRIRTGAYVIVGIKKTVTVRSGQTMEGISRSSLGPGMECYLEAVNGGKRELKAGESVNIPELKLKKRLR
uniref:HU family DNA-binding protein n=1 Tax=Prevotella sp. TaxID=59823 RepID=UPI00402A59BA